jgi:predicted dehydrogenase
VTERLDVGVIGVGSMGSNHARVYATATDARLVGVADADGERARRVAAEYDTVARPRDALLSAADAVSIAVPTRFHASVVGEAIAADVHALVEKPFVRDVQTGRRLATAARDRDLVLQVGHIERFNPAVETVRDLVDEHRILSARADRLGPPVDRDDRNSVVMDLMIHDIDILSTLLEAEVESVTAAAAGDGAYCTAQLTFETGTVATVTASRTCQKRTRKLELADPDRLLEVDYVDQSVRIHRQADPSYRTTDDGVRYRNQRVTEHPFVDAREPLKAELEAFLASVRAGDPPAVTAEEALRAVELAHTIRAQVGIGRDGDSEAGPEPESGTESPSESDSDPDSDFDPDRDPNPTSERQDPPGGESA